MIIISIHNATRERERESHPIKYPHTPGSRALKLQPVPSYGNSRSTLAPIQQPLSSNTTAIPG
jgi:hypothetical protein